jgi:hypothetical protein
MPRRLSTNPVVCLSVLPNSISSQGRSGWQHRFSQADDHVCQGEWPPVPWRD